MKLQCPCGAKYAFDTAPEMVRQPVKFVCPTCGLDHSDFLNDLIRREFGAPTPEYQRPVTEIPEPPAPVSKLKISHAEKTEAPAAAAPVSKYCQRHRGVLATANCATCGQPICPKCLEEFGYFCSPLCKNKADLQGRAAPVYAGQKFEVEKKFWRKSGLIFGILSVLLVLFLAAWIWYAWFGSVPHTYFAVRFADDDRAYAGKSQIVGDQIIFLHGGTLARYDLKTKTQVWSRDLISKDAISAGAKIISDAQARAAEDENFSHRQSGEDIEREVKMALQRDLQLEVSGQNIWVRQRNVLTHFDWQTGAPRVESFSEAEASATGIGLENSGGLFSSDGKPLNPDKVAEQAQNLKLPARIALPALLSNQKHEEELEAALRDESSRAPAKGKSLAGIERVQFVPGADGFVEFSKKILKENFVTRDAMRAAPKKSALDDPNLSAGNTGAAANDILNEMQRNRGGGTVTDDQSVYQIAVHLPNSSAQDFTAEVVGPPQLLVLQTVNVVTAGKTVIVLDKANKKLWQADLTYPISAGESFPFRESKFGDGPCVERDGVLYVFDEAILSAFDLADGNARWRIPSVGIVGLFFDDANFLYVNTTTGNPDDIKYSRQIDVTKHTDDVLLKLDPKTGKTIWSVKPGGFISYLSGKFIYTVESYDPNPADFDQLSDMTLQKPPYLRIARINPKDGRILWEHQEDRAPVDAEFDGNTIALIFKREVEVLKFLTF